MSYLKVFLLLALMPLIPDDCASTTRAAETDPSLVIGVEALMKSPDKHPGMIQVEGVVSSVSPKKGTLTLIDKGELEECGVANCAEYVLPVQWKGSFPDVKEVVQIKGEVKKVDGKKIFVAVSLKKVGLNKKQRRKNDKNPSGEY
jgi:hypothetical protein